MEIYTVKEAAKKLKVGVNTMYQMRMKSVSILWIPLAVGCENLSKPDLKNAIDKALAERPRK